MEEAPICLFCALGDTALKPGSPYLALCGFAWLVKRRHFPAQSDVSSQEDRFAVCVKQGKPAVHTQHTESIGHLLGSFALGLAEA